MTKDEFLNIVEPFTMTSAERIYALYDSMEYIRENNVQGDIVECGVWKAGNILGCIEYCKFYQMDKVFWLYDTFTSLNLDFLDSTDTDLDSIRSNINKTNYPPSKINFVVGDVLETLTDEKNIPNSISILRLDTDFYDSTKKELEVLFPKLNNNGIIIIDDYGHYIECKEACDEYFGIDYQEKNYESYTTIKFQKIDYTGIKAIKIDYPN